MSGDLIFVSGLSGAGKTTLVRAALNYLPDLHYLQTVTTRPRRNNEPDNFEYRFVSDDEYNILRSKANNWDHTEYSGYKYGADTDNIKSLLQSGRNVICCIAPRVAIAQSMSKLYGSIPIIIWVDTSLEVAKYRVRNDETRSLRIESDGLKGSADYIFTPSGHLEKDEVSFIKLLKQL